MLRSTIMRREACQGSPLRVAPDGEVEVEERQRRGDEQQADEKQREEVDRGEWGIHVTKMTSTPKKGPVIASRTSRTNVIDATLHQ